MGMGAQILVMLQIQTGYENATIFTSPASTYSGGIWEGLSIISRLPVLNSGYLSLSSSGGDANTRGTQWAQIQSPGGNVLYVYNTHFALDEQDRLTNAQQTLNLIGSNINGLCCLVGDLNGTPDDAAVQSLAGAGLVDVWPAANSGQNGYSFPSTGPTKRIDYCWASSSMASAVAGVSLVANAPSSGVLFASDHIGLLTSFNIS
jgi:endonuclease/exonuclease/phosphatase family metal-dependent hydrolase